MTAFRENALKLKFLTLNPPLTISFKISTMSHFFTLLTPNFMQNFRKTGVWSLLQCQSVPGHIVLSNVELIMYVKFQNFLVTGCRDSDKKQNVPKIGFPQKFFFKIWLCHFFTIMVS